MNGLSSSYLNICLIIDSAIPAFFAVSVCSSSGDLYCTRRVSLSAIKTVVSLLTDLNIASASICESVSAPGYVK